MRGLLPDLRCEHKNDDRLAILLKTFKSVIRSALLGELLPKRLADHTIEVEIGSKTLHRRLYQLSPAEQRATIEYIGELLEKGSTRRSKSPYVAPLLFVRESDELRGVAGFHALNKVRKRNIAPMQRANETFDRIRGVRVFSKVDLKTGFPQFRRKPHEIERRPAIRSMISWSVSLYPLEHVPKQRHFKCH